MANAPVIDRGKQMRNWATDRCILKRGYLLTNLSKFVYNHPTRGDSHPARGDRLECLKEDTNLGNFVYNRPLGMTSVPLGVIASRASLSSHPTGGLHDL